MSYSICHLQEVAVYKLRLLGACTRALSASKDQYQWICPHTYCADVNIFPSTHLSVKVVLLELQRTWNLNDIRHYEPILHPEAGWWSVMVHIAPQWRCGAHCALWVLGLSGWEHALGYAVCVIHTGRSRKRKQRHMQTCNVLRQQCEVDSCKSTARCPLRKCDRACFVLYGCALNSIPYSA